MNEISSLWLMFALAMSACEPVGDGRGPAANRQEHTSGDATTRARYATAGDPCASVADCPELPSASCVAWPGGYCTLPCDGEGGCEEGICVEGFHEGARALGLTCMRECANDRECRAGYACAWTIDGQVCAPAP